MTTSIKETLINNFDFFKKIYLKNYEFIINNLELKEYKKDELIYDKGSESHPGIFFLLSGTIDIRLRSL